MNRILYLLASLCAIGASSARAQDRALDSAEDRPRFLVVAVAGKPPVDASDAPVLRRRVTASMDAVPLGDALLELGRQVKVRFAVSPEMVPVSKRVSLHARDITLGAALFEVLGGLGLDVQFSRDSRGAAIVRRRRTGAPLVAQGAIVGQVMDTNTKRGIKGVEVLLEGTRWRAETDTAGRYRLTEIDIGTYTLTARRVGYAKQSRAVRVQVAQVDTVDLVLAPTAVKLDELVTTATGQQRRRDIGNAVTTIRADSVLQTAPIRNLTDLLENRVPGLTVRHTSGAPGDPARLRLRGVGSVMHGNDPVVIVDGVRIYATQSSARSGNLTNLGGAQTTKCSPDPVGGEIDCKTNMPLSSNAPAPSPLDQIDPNTIEKIDVFKGPSAATQYGADAANGVIVVTTKKGRPGPTRWNARLTHGRTTPPGSWPDGYYRWGHMAERGGSVSFCALTQTTCVVDSLIRFQALNNPDLTMLDQGRRTELSLSAYGGSQSLTYSVTGTYSDETGLLKLPAFEAEQFRTRLAIEPPDWMQRPHHLKNWSVTSNIGARLGPTANLSLKTSVVRTEQQRSTLENQLGLMAGVYVDQVNGVYYLPGQIGSFLFPVKSFLQDFYQRTTASRLTFNTGMDATWVPRSWFNAFARAGLSVSPREDETFQPSGFYPNLEFPALVDSGAITRATGRELVSSFALQGTVLKPLGWGLAFRTLFGANLENTTTSDVTAWGMQLQPGTSTLVGASQIGATEARTNTSVFGWMIEPQITGQRISISAGLRIDGSSAYGTKVTGSGGGSLFSLPKFSGSWVISEEPWFPFRSLFSSLRLRGAYGQSQVQPGPADRLRTYARRFVNTTAGNNPFLKLISVGNTQLRPERSVEFEGGFDADLIDSRISVLLTAARKVQVDAHMPVQLPLSVNGGGTIIQNIGNVRNTSLEFELNVTPVLTPVVTWTAHLRYTRARNTLVKLGNGVTPNKVAGVVEGYPVGSRWARPILGYTDANGNGVLERNEVRIGDSLVYMGLLDPKHKTTLFTNLALFRAITISAGFSYDAGATQVDQTAKTNWVLSRPLADPSALFSEQAAVLAMDSTEYGLTQDLSTFRFSSFALNYRAPTRVARLLRAQTLTVGIQGSNLWLNSTYRGKDPDVSAWSPTEAVRDTGQLPQPRTWWLSASLEY